MNILCRTLRMAGIWGGLFELVRAAASAFSCKFIPCVAAELQPQPKTFAKVGPSSSSRLDDP